ncbi:MAG: hypothetical protein JRG91_16405 [Deltaproteobacteria bacterium]|nr:hypothetical protein [Deltaproteobacteria bacterium]
MKSSLICVLLAAVLVIACSTEFVADTDADQSDAVDTTAEPAVDPVEEMPPTPCDREGFTPDLDIAMFDPDLPQVLYLANGPDLPFDQIRLDMFYGYGDPLALEEPGFRVLAATPDEQNYATCGTCVLGLVGVYPDSGDYDKLFFQTGGELEITALSEIGEPFAGTLRGLSLEEVTIEGSVTTPVPGGEGWCIEVLHFDTVLEPFD